MIHVDHALAIAIGTALIGFLAGCIAAFGVLHDPTASQKKDQTNDHH